MGVNKFDIIECQQLKVSGADKIENVANVTTQLKSLENVVAGDLTQLPSIPKSFDFTVAAGATNVVNVTIKCKDASGTVLTGIRNIEVFASDDSTGVGLASTWAIDSVAASTGAILTAITASNHLIAQTDADGVLTLAYTDVGTGAGYVCAVNPVTKVVETTQIEAGDYGT